MAQDQNYAVNYTIDVESTKGTEHVQKFADSVKNLRIGKETMTSSIANIKQMMKEIDAAFRTKGGKKRDYSFKMNFDTSQSEEKLDRIKVLLTEIGTLSKGVNLVINAGQKLDTNKIKANAQKIIGKKGQDDKSVAKQVTAATAAKGFLNAQRDITKSIGRINAAMISFQRGKEVNLKTDIAKARLTELLGLMQQLKSSGNSIPINVTNMRGAPGKGVSPLINGSVKPFVVSDKVQQKVQEKLYANKQLFNQKQAFAKQVNSTKEAQRTQLAVAKEAERQRKSHLKQQEQIRKSAQIERNRQAREEDKARQKTAADAVRQTRSHISNTNSSNSNRQKSAINRLQYSKAPSMRNMPMAYMFNAYMAYGVMKHELMDAVEYSNIMESARSILKVADGDLSTYETRFDKMAKNVRQIGVETKFTAIEIGGAVKYLAMAGMDIETINESIRPITNLALIGDNDVAQIADLTTNIMAGYDIKSSSMNSVADILASTVSRSNVNIIETAESFKMAAGYLKLAGVDFTEGAAAIGILGNAGIKGTMAGTSLRAMATRFAKPTKEAQKVLDRLNVKFTETHDVYGKPVERLKPLAKIFEELEKRGATMADMQSIFGKIGGNAAMMLVKNHDKLKELSIQNAASHGVSGELADVKQNTTKGLWYQATSQFSESFMQAFEQLEPQIRSVLKDFLVKFKAPEMAKGIATIGRTLLDLFSTMASIGTWIIKNFHWIEPLIFTGFVATKIFKLAGAVTNLGVALGFMGRQSMGSATMQALSSLTSIVGPGGVNNLTVANKRAIVTALSGAGVSGKGAMTKALASSGLVRSAGATMTRGAATTLFASQVASGNGLVGAGASIAALGTGAVAATAGIAGLVGILGWVAYKTWKVKEAKDAVLEDIQANRKYRYPSIEELKKSLNETYQTALITKKALNDLVPDKTIEQASGHKIGAFTGNWWASVFSSWGAGQSKNYSNVYSSRDAYQDDAKNAILAIAEMDSQSRINSAYAKLGKFTNPIDVAAFIQNIQESYGQSDNLLDKSLWTEDKDGHIIYEKGIGNLDHSKAAQTPHYAKYQNTHTVNDIRIAAQAYKDAISSYSGARNLLEGSEGDGFNFNEIEKLGFYLNSNGQWEQKELGKKATDKEREDNVANKMKVHEKLVRLMSSLRNTFGGSGEAAATILTVAGFPASLFSNEPDYNDTQPFNANRITNEGLPDDGKAGGNYSGTGKLSSSSSSPKQVIVNIANLLSVQTIDLMKSKEGQETEVKNLKEQLAQALIDVVHDFDASWNG